MGDTVKEEWSWEDVPEIEYCCVYNGTELGSPAPKGQVLQSMSGTPVPGDRDWGRSVSLPSTAVRSRCSESHWLKTQDRKQ